MANDKPKLSGMEMMVQSLLKAAGFDPTEITKATVTVVQQMQGGLQLVTDRLADIIREQQISKMERRAIMAHLGVPFADDSKFTAPAEILSPENHTVNGKDTDHV